MKVFREYLRQIQSGFATGQATEHSYRPALKTLLESMESGIEAINEPRRIACGAPDFIISRKGVPLGYIETKDLGLSLDDTEKSEQILRYRDSLPNLILTDYLSFRRYVDGTLRQEIRIGRIVSSGKIQPLPDNFPALSDLLSQFLESHSPGVMSSKDLAVRMAGKAQLIRDIIHRTFESENAQGALHGQLESFRKVLLRDLTPAQFADMYAQTICYGLFAARCNAPSDGHFTRQQAAYDLPKTNPFLRKLFSHMAGPDLDDRIAWIVDDLAELLNKSDMPSILKDFGKGEGKEDPVVHFYETFLSHYDPKMRELRGVYYTPEPVVSYIVRSVDRILKETFKLKDGLADNTKTDIREGKQKIETHRVHVLDPATGTGTFLYEVIRQISESFKGNKGLWPGYVSDHLLPRIHGFELLMAPYAIAHLKLGLELKRLGYDFRSEERLGVYLTNTMEDPHPFSGAPLFMRWLAEETNIADKVKRKHPIMVVLGNPPYSGHSANTGEWIAGLLRGRDSLGREKITGSYFDVDGEPLGEKNPKWLNDDYVKFIRFAQWRIERTGYGILAFVTNHGYLDNPTFRGMRKSLMDSFDDLYFLDLHGNSKKKEKTPEGKADKNVFDIQQGVAIGIFVKRQIRTGKKKDPRLLHADLWGEREAKYQWLASNDLESTPWKTVSPNAPSYQFVPQDESLRKEYEKGWKITDIMPINSVGIVTARDELTIWNTPEAVWETVSDFVSRSPEDAREKYDLGPDARDWKVELAQKDLKKSGQSKDKIQQILYRPFDIRYTYYTGHSRGFQCRPRQEVMEHMLLGKNLGLVTTRSIEIGRGWEHVFCTSSLIQHHTVSLKEVNYLFPLYLFETSSKNTIFSGSQKDPETPIRRSNLSTEFLEDLSGKLGMAFISEEKRDLKKSFGPEDVFYYVYAILHSPEYRSRYAGFLKIDFPRIPLTSDRELFVSLCRLGQELVSLHLLEKDLPISTTFPIPGENIVESVRYEPENNGQVWINATQYFEGVSPEVWNFHIGGYQVCQKWLKDRKGRVLGYQDLIHYQKIVAALSKTISLQKQIDEAIGKWPII
uniref:site-specific DNA-methyltransferase (adenine-specific) n=1 Tax=Leptospirillum sp. Group II '5-way CG' TaxID=419541 RepID=B6AMX0_9BACT|nr:MAG: DNA methyltransferase/helicase [Leptospirillum sp. Group II '5-way CG']